MSYTVDNGKLRKRSKFLELILDLYISGEFNCLGDYARELETDSTKTIQALFDQLVREGYLPRWEAPGPWPEVEDNSAQRFKTAWTAEPGRRLSVYADRLRIATEQVRRLVERHADGLVPHPDYERFSMEVRDVTRKTRETTHQNPKETPTRVDYMNQVRKTQEFFQRNPGTSVREASESLNISYYRLYRLIRREKIDTGPGKDNRAIIAEMAKAGKTVPDMVKELGISRQRVWQLVKVMGLDVEPVKNEGNELKRRTVRELFEQGLRPYDVYKRTGYGRRFIAEQFAKFQERP